MCETEFDLFKRNWKNELDKINRPNGSRSKLRTYCSFKQSFGTETYLSISIPNITEVPSPSLGAALPQLDWKQEGMKTCQRKKGNVSHVIV